MPSEKILEQKKAAVAELSEKMGRAAAGVLVKYQGITRCRICRNQKLSDRPCC